MKLADSIAETEARKARPNTGRQAAVVHQTGTTVAHSVPVRGAAHKPTRTDRKSDASLCSAEVCSGGVDSTSHHAKSGGTGDGVPGGGEAAVQRRDQAGCQNTDGDGTGGSCRPGLIACNSRQLDEETEEETEWRMDDDWLRAVAVLARTYPVCTKCGFVHVFRSCEPRSSGAHD